MTQATEREPVLSALSNQMADAVEQVGPAVVQVNGRARRPATGTVYATDLVVAAEHAVERDEELSVETADGRTLAAQLAGRDPATDLAVLRVAGLAAAAATLAAAAPRLGQFALAVGRPGAGELMASVGIVAAVGGPIRTPRGVLDRYVRTDATPYPGFSGGPLIDVRGAVLGILTSGLVPGVGLAVPADIAWRVANTLAHQGFVARGYLGIGSQPVRIPEIQRAGRAGDGGLLVVQVAAESPAARGGLLLGDIMVTFDGHPVPEAEDLQALLVSERVGATVPVEVIRGGALATLSLTVGQRGARR